MPTPPVLEGVKAVRDQLAEAQAEIATAPSIEAIKHQVETVLLEPNHRPHYEHLSDRLRAAYASFVSDHPSLAAAMDSLANELAKIGL